MKARIKQELVYLVLFLIGLFSAFAQGLRKRTVNRGTIQGHDLIRAIKQQENQKK